MAKTKLIVSIHLLEVIYKLLCGLVSLSNGKGDVAKWKIAIGTLILSLNSSLSFAQKDSTKVRTVDAKNGTITYDVMMEEEVYQEQEVLVTCYYGGPSRRVEAPVFLGKTGDIQKYIKKKRRYPSKARKNKIQGSVWVSYVVDINGDVKDISVLSGIGYGCDEEALRIVKSFPTFKCGYKYGEPADIKQTVIIEFKLP